MKGSQWWILAWNLLYTSTSKGSRSVSSTEPAFFITLLSFFESLTLMPLPQFLTADETALSTADFVPSCQPRGCISNPRCAQVLKEALFLLVHNNVLLISTVRSTIISFVLFVFKMRWLFKSGCRPLEEVGQTNTRGTKGFPKPFPCFHILYCYFKCILFTYYIQLGWVYNDILFSKMQTWLPKAKIKWCCH